MRKITIEFVLPDNLEADYADVCAQLVFEDLFPSEIGFKVVSDVVKYPQAAEHCAHKNFDPSLSMVCPDCGQSIKIKGG